MLTHRKRKMTATLQQFLHCRSLINCLCGEVAAHRAIWRIMALSFIGQQSASAVIENLVNTGLSYLNAFPAASRMQDELDRLQNTLPQFQAVLTAVEEGAQAIVQNEGMEKWLLQFKDAVENAENVLAELENRKQDRDDKLRAIFSLNAK